MANEAQNRGRSEDIKELSKKGKQLSDEDLGGVAGGLPPGSGQGGLNDTNQHMSDTEVDD